MSPDLDEVPETKRLKSPPTDALEAFSSSPKQSPRGVVDTLSGFIRPAGWTSVASGMWIVVSRWEPRHLKPCGRRPILRTLPDEGDRIEIE
eukprot:1635634-Prymnesium_polylepis.2